ncbi:hypothetical protein ACOMHN_023587 [Nucella lapillus]
MHCTVSKWLSRAVSLIKCGAGRRGQNDSLRDVNTAEKCHWYPLCRRPAVPPTRYAADPLCRRPVMPPTRCAADPLCRSPALFPFWGHIQPYVFTNLSWDNIDRLEATVTGAGKRFQDAGLGDLCVESGILAGGSVAGVFEGKAYKRGGRVHKCVLEALLRMIWQCFLPWVKDNHPDKLEAVNQLQDLVVNFHDDVGQAAFKSLLQQSVVTYVLHLWNDFLNYLRHDNGELSAFWMTYVDIIQDILLGLLPASREGEWDMHLHAIRLMIPWCFAYDRLNYARYLPAYYAQMTNLAASQPDIYKAFKDGNLSVQLTESNPFGRIPVDQTTEVTVNRDTQTVGGTTKFSLKPGAVSKYYLTAEYRNAFLTKLRNMV